MFGKRMNVMIGLARNPLRTAVLASVALAGLASVPTAAFGRHPDFRVDIIVPTPPVCVTPVSCRQMHWVEPTFQVLTEQVWVPAVTQQEIQRVIVPAEYEWRDVVSRDFFGQPHHFREQVAVCQTHFEDRQIDVVICAGHYEQQTHQQLMCAGHWADQGQTAVIRPGVQIGFHFPF